MEPVVRVTQLGSSELGCSRSPVPWRAVSLETRVLPQRACCDLAVESPSLLAECV